MTTEPLPLELILARNLVGAITVASFVTDGDGAIVFYNDAAGAMLGQRFEETGALPREEWRAIGPLDEQGRQLPDEDLPLRTALRHNRPAHGRFRIRTDADELVVVEVSALPLIGPQGFCGTIVLFWPLGDGEDG